MLNKQAVLRLQKQITNDDEALTSLFSALSDTGRYRIFKLLLSHHGLCVTDIANIMNISVPAASQQLKVLEMSGLIARERQGQQICYRIKNTNSVVRVVTRLISGLKPTRIS